MSEEEKNFGAADCLDNNLENRTLRALLEYPKLIELTHTQLLPEHFGSRQKANLYSAIIAYWKEYKEAPTADLLKLEIKANYHKDMSQLMEVALRNVIQLPAPHWEWIIKKLDTFISTIRLRKALFAAHQNLQGDKFKEAQAALVDAIRTPPIDGSSTPNDLDLSIAEINRLATDDGAFCCPTRIYALDSIIRGLYRKELFILMSTLNSGKSFGMVHLTNAALLTGKYVQYFTCEMSRERVLQRILQDVSGSARARHEDELTRNIHVWDNMKEGTKEEIEMPTLLQSSRAKYHLDVLKDFGGKLNVTEYASGEATVEDLQRDIAKFDVTFGKPPDLIIVDGLPDLKHSGGVDNLRHGLAATVKKLRAMAKEYEAAVAISHQANRSAMNADEIGAEHVGESLAIMQIADTACSLTVSRQDYLLGKAKLSIIRARNAPKFKQIEIYQNLAIGGFCQGSIVVEKESE